MERAFDIKIFDLEIKVIENYLKVNPSKSKSTNSHKNLKNPQKSTFISGATPRGHISKRDTKNLFSIPWSRILILLQITHMTPGLVKV